MSKYASPSAAAPLGNPDNCRKTSMTRPSIASKWITAGKVLAVDAAARTPALPAAWKTWWWKTYLWKVRASLNELCGAPKCGSQNALLFKQERLGSNHSKFSCRDFRCK